MTRLNNFYEFVSSRISDSVNKVHDVDPKILEVMNERIKFIE